MYDGLVNQNVIERFRPIVKDALTRVIREIVRRSISAMDKEAAETITIVSSQTVQTTQDETEIVTEVEGIAIETEVETEVVKRSRIETTEKELQAFSIVKSQFERSSLAQEMIFNPADRKEVPIEISYKDTTGYFGIYFNKPSWWIMRLNVDGRKNWVGFNVEEEVGTPLIPEGFEKMEESPYASFRVQISSPEDIDMLHRLVFAAFEKIIRDHKAPIG